MRLVPGKLYKITRIDMEGFSLFECENVWCQEGDLLLFLEKGKRRSATRMRYAYTPYYFLFGENKIELRQYYSTKIKDVLEEVEL